MSSQPLRFPARFELFLELAFPAFASHHPRQRDAELEQEIEWPGERKQRGRARIRRDERRSHDTEDDSVPPIPRQCLRGYDAERREQEDSDRQLEREAEREHHAE